MNRSAKPAEAEVAVDLAALGRTGEPRAPSLLPEIPVAAERKGRQLLLRLKLAPEQATAVRIQP